RVHDSQRKSGRSWLRQKRLRWIGLSRPAARQRGSESGTLSHAQSPATRATPYFLPYIRIWENVVAPRLAPEWVRTVCATDSPHSCVSSVRRKLCPSWAWLGVAVTPVPIAHRGS